MNNYLQEEKRFDKHSKYITIFDGGWWGLVHRDGSLASLILLSLY